VATPLISRRVGAGGVSVLTALLLATTLPVPSVLAVDRDCVTDASDQLNDQLSQAYEDYAEEMQQLAEQLNERSQMAYVSSSSSSRNNGNRNDVMVNQSVVDSAHREYSYGQNEANRRLSSKVQQAWNSYYVQSAACDGSQYTGANSVQYYQDNQYYNAANSNQYYQYSDPYYGNANYGQQYYQYNGYQQRYSYPNRNDSYREYLRRLNEYNREYQRQYQQYLQQFYHPYPCSYPCPYHQY
jgi:hypothetical protein